MRVVVGRAALDDGRELARAAAGSGRCGSRRARAPRGSRSCRARGASPSRATRPPAAQWLLGEQRRARAGRARRRRRTRGRAAGRCDRSSVAFLVTLRRRLSAARSSWTKSSTAAATSALRAARHVALAVGRDDRDLVLLGVEADVRRARCRSRRSRRAPCARACPRARSTPSGPCSAAKPISVWPGRRRAAASDEHVGGAAPGRSSSASRPSLRDLAVLRVARAGSRRPRPPSAAGRTSAKRSSVALAQLLGGLDRPRTRCRECAAARCSRRPRSPAAPRRAASRGEREAHPAARAVADDSAPSRAARAFRRR